MGPAVHRGDGWNLHFEVVHWLYVIETSMLYLQTAEYMIVLDCLLETYLSISSSIWSLLLLLLSFLLIMLRALSSPMMNLRRGSSFQDTRPQWAGNVPASLLCTMIVYGNHPWSQNSKKTPPNRLSQGEAVHSRGMTLRIFGFRPTSKDAV